MSASSDMAGHEAHVDVEEGLGLITGQARYHGPLYGDSSSKMPGWDTSRTFSNLGIINVVRWPLSAKLTSNISGLTYESLH